MIRPEYPWPEYAHGTAWDKSACDMEQAMWWKSCRFPFCGPQRRTREVKCAMPVSDLTSAVRRTIARGVLMFAVFFGVPALADDLLTFVKDELTIETADGERHDFTVELALTPQQRAQGLMFRRAMAEDDGMLFLFDREAPRSFWMKNTYLPLDLIFIDRHGVVVSIARDASPHDETGIPSRFPAAAVLEVLAGTSDAIGLAPGDQILYRVFED